MLQQQGKQIPVRREYEVLGRMPRQQSSEDSDTPPLRGTIRLSAGKGERRIGPCPSHRLKEAVNGAAAQSAFLKFGHCADMKAQSRGEGFDRLPGSPGRARTDRRDREPMQDVRHP